MTTKIFMPEEIDDPFAFARSTCTGKYINCLPMVSHAVQVYQAKSFGIPLVAGFDGWKQNDHCGCSIPAKPRTSMSMFQLVHIPKTGSSINYFLHDYFPGCELPNNATNPCPLALESTVQYLSSVFC